jgi:ribosomal protein S10
MASPLKMIMVFGGVKMCRYEMRIHKRLMDIIDPSATTVESLSNLNLPAGVDVEIKM